jgi:hypothetical protein
LTAAPAPRDLKLKRAAPAAIKLGADARALRAEARARQEAVLRTMRRLKSRRRLPG